MVGALTRVHFVSPAVVVQAIARYTRARVCGVALWWQRGPDSEARGFGPYAIVVALWQ